MSTARKVLLVDDDDDLRTSLKDQLVLHDEFEVYEAGTASKGMEAARNGRFDLVVFDAMVTPRPIGSAETARWRTVTAELPHVPDAIAPPSVTCRIGGYKLMFFGAQLMPDSPAQLADRYGSFECYRERVRHSVAGLESQDLYDARVESADQTAERARSLFPPTYSQTIPPTFVRRFRRR